MPPKKGHDKSVKGRGGNVSIRQGDRSPVVSSQFVTSVFELNQLPEIELPEVAFAGRSNVGKSSLMNRILNRKNLVKVSSRPGFTQSLNFFLVNSLFYMVDLPGYGFARAPKQVIRKWHMLVEGYLEQSRNLRGVVCILDIRRRPDPMDIDLLNYLNAINRRVWVVVNKADKVSQPKRKARRKEIAEALPGFVEKLWLVSARTGEGVPQLVNSLMEEVT